LFAFFPPSSAATVLLLDKYRGVLGFGTWEGGKYLELGGDGFGPFSPFIFISLFLSLVESVGLLVLGCFKDSLFGVFLSTCFCLFPFLLFYPLFSHTKALFVCFDFDPRREIATHAFLGLYGYHARHCTQVKTETDGLALTAWALVTLPAMAGTIAPIF
jgi:hypothetical protein